MTYHFKITIEGNSEDKESIDRLCENLKSEMWHENCIVMMPEITSTKTRCYRCGEHCEWDGPAKTYPKLLDIYRPSCPADSPMPKEFRDDGTVTENTKDCGYNCSGYCSNTDCDWFWMSCPFKTLDECPVHNEELE